VGEREGQRARGRAKQRGIIPICRHNFQKKKFWSLFLQNDDKVQDVCGGSAAEWLLEMPASEPSPGASAEPEPAVNGLGYVQERMSVTEAELSPRDAETSPRIGLGARWSQNKCWSDRRSAADVWGTVGFQPPPRRRGLFRTASTQALHDAHAPKPYEGFDPDFERPAAKARRMGLIVPGGPRKAMWDWVIAVLVCYIGFTVPVELAFAQMPEGIEVVVDLIFLADMFASFRVVTFASDGSPVLSVSTAAKAYLRKWFVVDLLGLFPFDRIAAAAAGGWTIEVSDSKHRHEQPCPSPSPSDDRAQPAPTPTTAQPHTGRTRTRTRCVIVD
jgi:hypothetical protein